jgi:hypothetical protein
MIVGAGSGAVYGIRINCPTMSIMFPCSSSRVNFCYISVTKGTAMLFGNGLDKGFDYVMDLLRYQFRTLGQGYHELTKVHMKSERGDGEEEERHV